jgi:hypothetical protein
VRDVGAMELDPAKAPPGVADIDRDDARDVRRVGQCSQEPSAHQPGGARDGDRNHDS